MKWLILWILALGCWLLEAKVVEESVTYLGVKFRVVRVAPDQVQLVWKNAAGEPYRTFDQVQAAYKAAGKTTVFLMNAGIYEPGGIPSGLHIEQGKTLNPLNLANAPGNFFLKPNGVMWVEKNEKSVAFIGTSESFAAREKLVGKTIETGVQSGPMLLINGVRHPAFREGSTNKLYRNGVGVDSKNRIVFAITDKAQDINLWDFAGLFLHLDCQNALFLDGDISKMTVNPTQPAGSNRFGAMFVILE